jgi:hypothetical protein
MYDEVPLKMIAKALAKINLGTMPMPYLPRLEIWSELSGRTWKADMGV